MNNSSGDNLIVTNILDVPLTKTKTIAGVTAVAYRLRSRVVRLLYNNDFYRLLSRLTVRTDKIDDRARTKWLLRKYTLWVYRTVHITSPRTTIVIYC